MKKSIICEIKTPAELSHFMKDQSIENILLGNGFSLSHPQYGPRLKWSLRNALTKDWEEIKPKKSKKCPEKDLNLIRLELLKRTIKYYTKILFERGSHLSSKNKLRNLFKEYQASNFTCSLFEDDGIKNIFTINYDPILYFEILNELSINADKFKDGFYGEVPKTQPRVIADLNQKDMYQCKVHFLHGSWYLQYDIVNDNIRKLSFGNNSKHTTNTIFEDNYNPLIILEDRWETKCALINSCHYFKGCLENLTKLANHIFIFGCSFENDDHIIQAICEKNKNGIHNAIKVYITYRKQDTSFQSRVYNLFMKYNKKHKKISNIIFIPIKDKHILWKATQQK